MPLLFFQEHLVVRRVHRRHEDVRCRRGQTLAFTHHLLDDVLVDGPAGVDELTQRLVHGGLALLRRQVQDRQVMAGGVVAVALLQGVVRHAEAARREQIVPVAVVLERARLPHQPVDHVPVVDLMLAAAAQTRHPLHLPLGVPDLHVLSVEADIDLLAREPAVHRVHIVVHVDEAAVVHSHAPYVLARLRKPRGLGQRLSHSFPSHP